MAVPLPTLAAALASLLYALVGVAVLAARPRSAPNRAFALYAVASGVAGILDRLMISIELLRSTYFSLGAPLYALAAGGVVGLALTFPTRLGREEASATRMALAWGGALAGILLWAWSSRYEDQLSGAATLALAWGILMAMSAASAVLFAMRAARSPEALPAFAAMSLAVYLPAALGVGNSLDGASMGYVAFAAANIGAVVVAWGWVGVRLTRPAWSIAVVWGSLATALAAQLTDPVPGSGPTAIDATIAAVRLLAILLLAFLIVRGQVPGLETRVRWTVSRGTIAAAFVAVFFLASESAQILFGQGNQWVGLFAAGALVFALAPLQRAAERLAERAVPAADASVAAGRSRAETSYRRAVRFALRDRRITREEESHLHELARDLGIDGARAHAILVEVERERTIETRPEGSPEAR